MRLTSHTDYALRVLIHLGSKDGELATIPEVAAAYGISRNHLMKVVHRLGRQGYVRTVQGRAGGFRLARAPETIGVGEVVRAAEGDMALVACFRAQSPGCRIMPACRLQHVLHEALAAFLAVLDRYSLADLLQDKAMLRDLLGLGPEGAGRALEM